MEKVVIITGGSDGIGKALCFEFGRRGYRVVFTGRNQDKIDEVAASLSYAGIVCLGLKLDAASDEDNQVLINRTMEKYGRLDVLIGNAGVSMRALFAEISLETFDKVFQVNFHGFVSLVKHALPHLIQSKGAIIGISSINGRRATPARTAYAASKYAMEGFLESLRMELMHEGVHVLSACPGFTKSNLRSSSIMKDGKEQGVTRLNESKMMSAERAAALIYRAFERKKRDLLLTTQGKLAVWANKFFPGLMDKVVFKVMSKKADSPFYQPKH